MRVHSPSVVFLTQLSCVVGVSSFGSCRGLFAGRRTRLQR